MANSDFYYGAYPAEYSNSLSGIFDMKMRNGNTTDFAHAVQLGIWGFDLSSERPIKRKVEVRTSLITVTHILVWQIRLVVLTRGLIIRIWLLR